MFLESDFAMLADYLNAEFVKRRGALVNYDITDWAKEIGINAVTLRSMMNQKAPPVQIHIDNYNILLSYFGDELRTVLGISEPPATPKKNY